MHQSPLILLIPGTVALSAVAPTMFPTQAAEAMMHFQLIATRPNQEEQTALVIQRIPREDCVLQKIPFSRHAISIRTGFLFFVIRHRKLSARNTRIHLTCENSGERIKP